MSPNLNNSIQICYWNIHGIKSEIIQNKLLDPEFINKLNNSDIVALSELHTEEKELFLPGYKFKKHKIRRKTHKGPKIGGGIAVFVKECISDLVHVVPNTNENSVWVKLKNKSPIGSDLFIGSYYISPSGKKDKFDTFNVLTEETKRFQGKVILSSPVNF